MVLHTSIKCPKSGRKGRALIFRRNRIKNTRGTVLAAVPLLILSSYLKELRLKFSEFLPIYCSFLFYRRSLNSRRTFVRLRSRTTISALNLFAPGGCDSVLSQADNTQRYKSLAGFAICFAYLAKGEIFKTRYLLRKRYALRGVRDDTFSTSLCE